MSEYSLNKEVFTKKMKDEVKSLIDWLRSDYQEASEKVCKPKATYEFEAYQEMKAVAGPNGWTRFTYDENGRITYECILKITFPLRCLPFKAVDVHTYRWNEKHQEWEHESTEIF